MGRSSELFMEMLASKMQPDEYFHWLNTQEEMDELIQADNTPQKITIEDLDNIFTCADDVEENL